MANVGQVVREGYTFIKRIAGSPDTSCYSATTMQSIYPRHLEIPTFINPRSMEKEAKAAQLTIFYDGQVVVFDDFLADKVQ
ncbi:hypothetical protein JHK84_042772 [Glycine max]|nr:hypothetical protein JHK84_042772 [Glycine max]